MTAPISIPSMIARRQDTNSPLWCRQFAKRAGALHSSGASASWTAPPGPIADSFAGICGTPYAVERQEGTYLFVMGREPATLYDALHLGKALQLALHAAHLQPVLQAQRVNLSAGGGPVERVEPVSSWVPDSRLGRFWRQWLQMRVTVSGLSHGSQMLANLKPGSAMHHAAGKYRRGSPAGSDPACSGSAASTAAPPQTVPYSSNVSATVSGSLGMRWARQPQSSFVVTTQH